MAARKSVFQREQSVYSGDFDQDDQCGVNFDEDCLENGTLPPDFEEEGECDEDDEECLAAYIENLKKTIKLSNASKVSLSAAKSDSKKEKKVEPPFEGLPADYLRKKYRPDYPRALRMKRVCSPKKKNARQKTGGMTFAQPKALFIPSETHLSSIDSRISVRRKSRAKPREVVKGPTLKSLAELGEPSPLAQNRMQIPILSGSDEMVVEWLDDHNIQMMLEYFLGLCVIQQPEDPWAFISELCEKMIEARVSVEAFESLPKILSPEHSEAVFRIYDRIENGFMTRAQYKSAMDTMGLVEYSMNPEGWDENAILKDTFVKESTEAIDNLLRSFMVFSGDLPLPPSKSLTSPEEEKEEEEEEEEGVNKETAKSSSTLRSGSASSYETYSRSVTASEFFDDNDNEIDDGFGGEDYYDKEFDRKFDNFDDDNDKENDDENEENEDENEDSGY